MPPRKKKRKSNPISTRKRNHFPVFALFVFIFIIGVVFGGGGVHLFGEKKITFNNPYYSPKVYLPPSGFVLGDKDKAFNIPILLYHYVEINSDPKDTIRISLTIPRNVFEKQIQSLLSEGYTFLTVSEVGKILDGKMAMPGKAVVLTFDDGYRDFYTDVFPLLQFYNIKATLFVVSGFLNHSNNITNEQLSDIVKSGLVEIGGHTVNHASLTSLSKERAKWEIEEDKKILEQKFGIKMTSFAYPYGLFDEDVANIVKDAGYLQAVSVIRGNEQTKSNRYFLFRIRPGAGIGEYLIRSISMK